jgi:capsular polysaccharide biosynthesis protein
MYLVDALRVLLRRWKIVVVGVVALIAAAGAVVHYVPTQYQATGQLLLVLPADATGKQTPTNPFLNLQTGLVTVASLAASSVMTKDESRSMVGAGYTSTYAAAVSPGNGPLIVITSKDSDPAEAVRTRDEVMRRIDQELAHLQSGVDVPPTQLITSRPIAVAAQADVLPGSKIRALTAAGGGIVLITLIVAFSWEGMVNRRRSAAADPPTNVSTLRTPEPNPVRPSAAAQGQPAPTKVSKSNKRRTRRPGR